MAVPNRMIFDKFQTVFDPPSLSENYLGQKPQKKQIFFLVLNIEIGEAS